MKKFKHAMQGYFNEVVEGADGGAVAILDEPDETPQDAVLAELGLDDAVAEGAEAIEGLAAEPASEGDVAEKAETAPAADKPEDKQEAKPAEEKKPESITEADLAPLNGKNQSTNERFRKVTEGYKQEKTRADALEAEVQRGKESFDSLRQLGFSDEAAADDLVEFSVFRKALGSGDADVVRHAIELVVKKFEATHGKRVAVNASALDDYPDLKSKVDTFDLPEETALEIIRGRKTQEFSQNANKQREQVASDESQHNAVISQAVESVKALQAGWEKTDPDFIALMPLLHPQMEEIARNFPPDQWPKIVDMQYKTLKKTMSAQALQRTPASNPLRGNGHRAGTPAPSSPQEAVLQELGLSD